MTQRVIESLKPLATTGLILDSMIRFGLLVLGPLVLGPLVLIWPPLSESPRTPLRVCPVY